MTKILFLSNTFEKAEFFDQSGSLDEEHIKTLRLMGFKSRPGGRYVNPSRSNPSMRVLDYLQKEGYTVETIIHTAQEARNMRSNINIEGRISIIGPREITTKSRKVVKVRDANLEDTAGEPMKITLWAEDDQIPDGAIIRIINGYTTELKDGTYISKGKHGRIYVL